MQPLSDIFSGTPRVNSNSFMQQLNRIASPGASNNEPKNSSAAGSSPKRPQPSPKRQLHASQASFADSGYHGSQSQDVFDASSFVYSQDQMMKTSSPVIESTSVRGSPAGQIHQSPTKTRVLQSPTTTFTTAREEQTAKVMPDATQRLTSPQITRTQNTQDTIAQPPSSPVQMPQSPSPKKSSPLKTSPVKSPPVVNQQYSPVRKPLPPPAQAEEMETDFNDDNQTHSDGSSPIRPLVRKSSLNFASLPAREPLNTGKSLGGRMSRSSNLGLNRTSYYGRATGGKSLGHAVNAAADDDDEMDVDEEDVSTPEKPAETEDVAAHNKSYTQRLQDQISMLGKSQPRLERLSKSIPNFAPTTPAPPPQSPEQSKASSPVRKPTTPGAFPEDDDDDWIQPPTTVQPAQKETTPGPAVPPKDYPVGASASGGAAEFVLPKQRPPSSHPASPQRPAAIPDRAISTTPHTKSASVSAIPDNPERMDGGISPKKAISVSNPSLAAASEPARPETPKSPTRSLRESPLKSVKNKLSSILKSSKGLLASSAALSAEGKSSMLLSPSTTRLGFHGDPSTETVNQVQSVTESVYPDLTQALVNAQSLRPASPSKASVRRTRASAERERKEKQQEKETRRMEEQMDKLDKVRSKEAEKARVFSKEQERLAAMEKQVAAQKEQERKEQEKKEQEQKRPATAMGTQKFVKATPQRARAQTQTADRDVEMQDVTSTLPRPAPSSISRPATSQAMRTKELKRPMRPTKETAPKSRAAPTVIKVNMGAHHSQYHPSNNALSANLHEALGPSTAKTPVSKAGQSKLKSKSSIQSLKSSASSVGRPKALELAARRKEQEEREAQRKRDAKAEMERKRTAMQEEERRQEQQRRLDAEKQREREREAAEAKKNAQRQAAIEKAKMTRAPPPAVRSQPNGPPDYAASASQDARGAGPARPPSRMGSALFRSQDDVNRPVNALLSNAGKGQKRPLGQDNDGGNARAQQVRVGTTYQAKDGKRRRTSQELDDEMESLPNIKGPPVRPSAGYKKVSLRSYRTARIAANDTQDMPTKPMYPGGYTAGPQSGTRDLFKSAVTSQHNSAIKANALDTAQFSKGAIPFASNPSQQTYKTPGRPGVTPGTAKSATRASPRFQNGDAIELPEIQTDDEDDDSDGEAGATMASWADSPDLRRALLRQETMDPSQIFGPPAPLNMEEVFSKSKDRWHKFRARTSSANWSGNDRLTEEDIRKDIAARDRLRREGAWTYEMSKEL